jgi:hypothetical protein
MPLSLNFSITKSEDGKTVTATDATGDYAAGTNEGGYGAPNPDRNTLALIVLLVERKTGGDVSYYPDPNDPETADTFVFHIENDGHYQLRVWPLEIKAAQTPDVGVYVYDATADEIQRGDGTQFLTATVDDLNAENNTFTPVEDLQIADLTKAFVFVNRMYVESMNPANKEAYQKTTLEQLIMELDNQIIGNSAKFVQGAYSAAQKNIELYSKKVQEILIHAS